MRESEAYASPHAVEQAIKSAAKQANTENPTLRIDDLIRQAHFDRFLCRIFSEGEESEWVLKGGTGISSESRLGESNSRPTHYECVALPTELRRPAPISWATIAGYMPSAGLGLQRMVGLSISRAGRDRPGGLDST